jgi:hypothetical protein
LSLAGAAAGREQGGTVISKSRFFALALALLATPALAAEPATTVFLGGDMTREERLAFTSALAAARHPGVLHFDTPKARPHLAGFLRQFGASAVVPVGRFSDLGALTEPPGLPIAPAIFFENGHPVGLSRILFPDPQNVARFYLALIAKPAAVRTIVVANPASDWATMAPWLAAQKHAALLFTDNDGKNVAEVVDAAVRRPELQGVDHVILLGDAKAIPVQTRPNPIAGKDPEIEMEPLTPQSGVFTYAVGRLTGPDLGVVALQLARQRLLKPGPKQAVLVSNPGGGLPLLETVSQHTAQELRYAGYQTDTLMGKGVTAVDVRAKLPAADLFLWEGHQATLFKEFGFADWTEPLRPSLVILQSCLALTDAKSLHLLERGALGVVGTSTRTYSATGGAFALAYVDSLLYDRQTVGGALRTAKNFLVTYQMLKEGRLSQARLNGANARSSWAFTLWGDPTLTIPVPDRPAENHPAAHAVVEKSSVTIEIPPNGFERVSSGKYTAATRPNTRLAGLIRTGDEAGESRLVPFVFTEIVLGGERTPKLTSKLPKENWAFAWDARRGVGYLLVLLRPKDAGPLRFHIEWAE